MQRRARKWIVTKIVFGTKWADWDQEDVQLRDDGYPKYLETGKTIGTFVVRDVKAKFPDGNYVVLYDGDGTLDFGFDAKVLRSSAGRIEIFANYTTWLNNGNYLLKHLKKLKKNRMINEFVLLIFHIIRK